MSLSDYDAGPETRRAAAAAASKPQPYYRFVLGARAARESRWDAAQRELDQLESVPGPRPAAGGPAGESRRDSLAASDAAAYAHALRGFIALERADSSVAIRELREALPKISGTCPGYSCYLHGMLRYLLGRALLDSGQPRDARPYLESVEFDYPFLTPALLYLGKTYEELGDLPAAKLRYEQFVRWWRDCDPELRPLWEEGRRAVARLRVIEKL